MFHILLVMQLKYKLITIWQLLGKFENGDHLYDKVAETMFENGGYIAEHPLTRSWD